MKVARIRIICIVIIAVLTLGLAAGGVYAYMKSTYKGYPQTIHSTTVFFRVNGRDYMDAVTSYDLKLSRGDEVDAELIVTSLSSGSVTALMEYTINFSFTAGDSELARAIEMYRYDGADYVFVCMLSDITSVSDYLATNTSNSYGLRFVYSAGASDYFDGKTFTLQASVNSRLSERQDIVVSGTNKALYVVTEKAFRSALESEIYEGRIITLLDDVTLTSDVSATKKIGVNLNGRTLDLNGHNISFAYSDATDADVGFVDNSLKGGAIAGNGTISISGDDVYLVGDKLSPYFNKFSYPLNSQAAFDAFVNYVTARANALSGVTYLEGKHYPLLDNLSYHLAAYDVKIAGLALYNNDNEPVRLPSLVTVSDNGLFVTSAVSYQVNAAYAPLSLTGSVSSSVMLRGNSSYAVAEYMLDNIPSVIAYSLFLPVYDEVSGAEISWVVDDGMSGAVFDENGLYLRDGYESLASWDDRTLRLGILVADGENWYNLTKENMKVQILSAEQRTNLIYNSLQAVMSDEGETLDVRSDCLLTGNNAKVNLIGISLGLGRHLDSTAEGGVAIDGTNLDNTVSTDYLVSESTGDAGFSRYKVNHKPNSDNSATVNTVITFTYDNGGTPITYSVEKSIVVLGYVSSIELYSAREILQSGFSVNDYVDGTLYDFTTMGYFDKTGNYLEYTVDPAYASYFYVSNNDFVADPKGSFVAVTEEGVTKYAYVSGRYSYNEGTGVYVSDSDGEYLFVAAQNLFTSDRTYSSITSRYIPYEGASLYSCVASLSVKANLVPAYDITAIIRVKLFDIALAGDPAVLTKSYVLDAMNEELSYELTMHIKGIYHNIPTEISDTNVYNALLSFYDINGNGHIEVEEAKTEWYDGAVYQLRAGTEASLGTVTNGGTTYRYIDLSSLNIPTLKGIEYFDGIRGLNLSSNNITDISLLSDLRTLEYLNLNSNTVTNLEGLAYMDSLGYFSVRENNVTSIEALRYLNGLKYVDLYHNAIPDILPLTEHTNLTYLDVRINNNDYYNEPKLYAVALTMANNPGITVYANDNSQTAYTVGAEKIVAAKAISELQMINEIYQTLYMPTTYRYFDGTDTVSYDLQWNVEVQGMGLAFTNDANNQQKTVGYTITTPIVNQTVNVLLRVKRTTETAFYDYSRPVVVTILQSRDSEAQPYIWSNADSAYVAAETLVSDPVLLSKLFSVFNTDTSANFAADNNGNPSVYREQYTISYDEIENPTTITSNINWADGGITDLTGLRNFANLLSGVTLDLSGNVFNLKDDGVSGDITELGFTPGIVSLTLGGQRYDFNDLAPQDGTLTSLTSLYAEECYDLSDDDVLAGLYRVYLRNTAASIYITPPVNSVYTAWNPYAELLPKYVNGLRSTFAVKELSEKVYLFDTHRNYVTFNFYGVDLTFYYQSASGLPSTGGSNDVITTFGNTLSIANAADDTNDNLQATFINYAHNSSCLLAGNAEAYYAKITLAASDGRSGATQNVTYAHFIAQINVMPKDDIYVVLTEQEARLEFGDNTITGSVDVPVSQIFTGRTIRKAVYRGLTTLFRNETSVASRANLTNTYYRDGSAYYVTTESFKNVNFTDSVGSSMSVDGSYDFGGTALNGLQYIPKVTNLTVLRDAYFGSGKALTYIETLYANFAGINFGTLDSDLVLTRLTSLYFGYQGSTKRTNVYCILYGRDSGGNIDYYLRHMPNLVTLKILDSCVTDWNGLLGLIDENGKCKLKYLQAYATTNAATNHKANTSLTVMNALVAAVKLNYGYATDADFRANCNYYIGSSTTERDTTTEYPWTNVTTDDPYMTEPLKEYNEFYSYIYDLGAYGTVNGTSQYLYKSGAQEFSVADTIRLPYTTYNMTYGTDFNKTDYFDRAFAIEWQLVGTADTAFMTTAAAATAGTNLVSYTVPEELTTYGDTFDLTVKTQTYDYYVVLVGTIGDGYYDTDFTYNALSATKRTFIYPILVKGTHKQNTGRYSLANFKDTTLRLKMFEKYFSSTYDGSLVSSVLSAETSLTLNGYSFSSVVREAVNEPTKIYSLAGIGAFTAITSFTATDLGIADITDLSLCTGLTSVTMDGNLVASIAPLRGLSLQTLVLNGNVVKDLSTLTGSTLRGTLKTLNLNYNHLISASDIACLGTGLTTLNIYGTRCTYDYYDGAGGAATPFEALYTLLTAKGSAMSVAITSETATSLTAAEISTFLSDIRTNLMGTLQLADFNNGTMTINSVTYSYSYNATALSGKNNIGKETNVPKTVSSSANTQLVTTFDVNFRNASGTEATLVGRNGVTYTANPSSTYTYIDMDGAFWAYLIETMTNGTAAATIEITENKGITSLRNINKFAVTSILIKKNRITELWATAQADFAFPGLTSLTIEDAIIPTAKAYCLSGASSLTTLDIDGSYGIDFDVSGTLASGSGTLRSWLDSSAVTVSLLNNQYNLGYYFTSSLAVTSYDAATRAFNENYLDWGGNLSAAVLTAVTTEGTSGAITTNYHSNILMALRQNYLATKAHSKLKVPYTPNEDHANPYDNIHTSYYSDGEAIMYRLLNLATSSSVVRDIANIDTMSYAQASSEGIELYLPKFLMIDGVSYPITWESTFISNYVFRFNSGNIALVRDVDYIDISATVRGVTYEKTITITDKVVTSGITTKTYYIQVAQNGPYIDTAEIFESGRLVEHIFTRFVTTDSANYNSAYDRYEMSYALLMSITKIQLTNSKNSTDENPGEGVTSLVGLEYFTNLVDINISKGNIIEIEPLRGLSLQRFEYHQSNDALLNNNIEDFSPLYEGNSRTTLKNFTYSSSANTTITDLSFLVAFTVLERVELFGYATVTDNSLLLYVAQPSFRYTVAYCSTHSGAKFYTNQAAATAISTLGNKHYANWTFVQDGYIMARKFADTGEGTSKGNAYRFIPTAEWVQAAEIISQYDAGENAVLRYDTLIDVTDKTTSSIKLSAVVDDAGVLYLVDWFDALKTLTTERNTYLMSIKYGRTITVGGHTYADGDALTAEQATAVLADTQFRVYYNSGEADVFTDVTAERPTGSTRKYGLIGARVEINGLWYEKIYSVKYGV